MESQLAKFQRAFVRISTEDDVPVGAGFLVSEEHVMTCAHVVAAALGDRTIEAQNEVPQGTVHLNFHFLEEQPHRTAHVVHWQPRAGPETNPSGDIAVLRLSKGQPDEAQSVSLTVTSEVFDHEFRAHGFPVDANAGAWAYGMVRDPLGNGWLQVEDIKEQGRRIEGGFSGSPIQDTKTGRFFGMVAASLEYVRAAKVGYVIPTEMLARDYPRSEQIDGQPLSTLLSTSPVQTHVVDSMYRGDYTTITEAIEAAAPGDRILVRPGLYEEGLVVDKPLEIVGQGDLEEIVVEASRRNALAFKTTMGRVSNLTLWQAGDEREWFGVDVAQGRLEIEGCNISSDTHSCVGIYGGAHTYLRNNRIHDGKAAGVFVTEGGKGTLEGNDIFANADAGVAIREGSEATLRNNRIRDGKQAGVLVYEGGKGTLEDNDIFTNAKSGVEIREGSESTLRNNRIHDNNSAGVAVYEGGKGTLEGNDIFGHSFYGVAVNGEDSNGTLRNNRIHDNKGRFGFGVLVNGGGKGTLEGNDIYANGKLGVAVSGEGSNGTLRNNRINKNAYEAVYVHDRGGGTFEDNDLLNNGGKGAWDVSEDSMQKVKRARNKA